MAIESTKNTFSIGRTLGRNAVKWLRVFMRCIPLWLFKILRVFFIGFGYCAMFNKRKVIMRNLEIAYGDTLSIAEKKKISADCFYHFGKGMVDLIFLIDRPEIIKNNIKFEGLENLENALKTGRGVVFFGAHYGNFILMYIAMAAAGYKTNVIMKRVRDEEFEKYITQFRNERHIHTIYDLPARKCVVQCIKALRNNETLTILIDQNYGSAGRVFVDFFGRKAATAAGPVVFANRTGAAVLPIFIHTTGDLEYKICIDPPVDLIQTDNEEESIEQNIAMLTKILEEKIRLCPYQWGGWMHKRWKTLSDDEQQKVDRLLNEGKIPDKVYNK